ncbi:MAG: peptidoglycan-binding protein [Myxococcaceae bacterium]
MKVLQHRVTSGQAKEVKAELKTLANRAVSTNVLNLGDTGNAVKALQNLLRGVGAYTGPVSGTFDAATEAALKGFQGAKKLTASGALDKKTYAALKSQQLFLKKGKAFAQAAHVGQRGGDILAAEKKLAKLGFLNAKNVDGTFDAATAKAVERYRKADHEVPDKGHAIGNKFYSELSKASNGYEHANYRKRDVTNAKGVKQHKRLDDLTTKTVGSKPVTVGSKGRAVLNIEKHLEAAGYEIGNPSTTFGSRSAAAVKAFQRHAGLPQTGEVDGKTWSKLKGALFAATTGTTPTQSKGEKDGSVLRTEKLLKKLGYKGVKADGLYDGKTAAAVKKFQKKHHIKQTGSVGSGTMKAIQKEVKKQSGGAFAQRVLKLARSQMGNGESPPGSNNQKYSHFFGRGNEPWCADFVSWCYTKSGKKLNIPYTPTLLQYMKNNGTYNRHNPKPGEIVIFDWHPGSGVPAEHTGLVEKVYRKNGQLYIQTIEGNNGDRVRRRNVPVSWSMIAGFGTVK